MGECTWPVPIKTGTSSLSGVASQFDWLAFIVTLAGVDWAGKIRGLRGGGERVRLPTSLEIFSISPH